MVDDFRRRFWVSLGLTIPVLATSEMLQHILGLRSVQVVIVVRVHRRRTYRISNVSVAHFDS